MRKAGRKHSRDRVASWAYEEIGAIFISFQKDFMCINSFSSQNNLVMVFVIFSIFRDGDNETQRG